MMDEGPFAVFGKKFQVQRKVVQAFHCELVIMPEIQVQLLAVEPPARFRDFTIQILPAYRIESKIKKMLPAVARLLHQTVRFRLQGIGVLPISFEQAAVVRLGIQAGQLGKRQDDP